MDDNYTHYIHPWTIDNSALTIYWRYHVQIGFARSQHISIQTIHIL